MVSALSPSAQRFLSDLGRLDGQTAKAQRQIGSGLRIERPSDDPERLGELLRIRARLDETVQVQSNLERVDTQTDAGEQAVQAALSLLDRAVQIATLGAGTSATAEEKNVLAIEVAGLRDRMQGLTGTSAAGVNVFGTEAAEITDADGFRFQSSRTAAEVFEAPLSALDALRSALLSANSVDTVLGVVKAAQQRTAEHIAFYGCVQNRIETGLDTASRRETSDRAALAAIRETDVAEAAIELTEARTQREAALAAQAKLPRTSLFDYLG